jgi:PPM family protein phosphatase
VTTIRYGRHTDVGKVRRENQDSAGMTPDPLTDVGGPKGALFVVADGMGGHRAGRRASELAVSTILESYASAPPIQIPDILRAAMGEANTRVFEEGSRIPAYNAMGTTCSVLVVQESSAWIGHIGDSKIFLVTPAGIRQLTTDHSRVWELYVRGVITREQARVHPERNLLTRALGTKPELEADISGPFALETGSRLVMCTDGLTNHVEEEDIRRLVEMSPPQKAAEALVALANERGGTDNITVQIVEVGAG